MCTMTIPNADSSAELFVAGRMGTRSSTVNYRRFDKWEDAVRYAVEVVDLAKFPGTVIEVDELRYDSNQISDLFSGLSSASGLRPDETTASR